MSNYLAIATVTAVLQRTLQAAIQVDVDGARVTTLRPDDLGKGTPEAGVNIFLYQVTPNYAWGNSDIPSRRSKGDLVKRTQTALDLHYLLSCYGNDVLLEPQRLLGSVVRTLQDRSILSPEMIRDAIADSAFTFLENSNLADQLEPVRIIASALTREDLSKLLSGFAQTLLLSVAYQGTVVLIEGEDPGQRALPIRSRQTLITPYSPFSIDRIVPQGGATKPILTDSTLLIQGKQLLDRVTWVRINGVDVPPSEVSNIQVTLPLSSVPASVLRAGVQSLQVVHPIEGARLSGPYRGIESNVAAFVLRPTLLAVSVSDIEGSDNDPRSANVTVRFNLIVGASQRVVLILNEWSVDSPTAYVFKAESHLTDTEEVTIPINYVKPGEYLVRVQIDGAESLLSIDKDPDSATFDWFITPRIAIS